MADGKLAVAGIAPEQHGDRLALFLQWKGMEQMPVMLDSFNELGLKVVPITLLVDESGVVRYQNPKAADLDAFLAQPPAEVGSASKAPRPRGLARDGHGAVTPGPTVMIERLEKRITSRPEAAAQAHFELGVAYRKRYDSPARRENDFGHAVANWRAALAKDPSNYIRRRRLQQYGPRLDKPYSFYDWVTTARTDLRARGVKPHGLVAEPVAAELARPRKGGPEAVGPEAPPHPDPAGKLPADQFSVFGHEVVLVPHTSKPQEAICVHVTVTPRPAALAKWNDEAGLSSLHVSAPEGWTASSSALVLPVPDNGKPPLTSPRHVEFELRRDGREEPLGKSELKLEFFYHACHGATGVCQLLRSDAAVPFPAD